MIEPIDRLRPVILCGGEGARLWPVSRKERPKPFLVMQDGFSLVQHAFRRAATLAAGSCVTVTNREIAFQVIDDYRVVGGEKPLDLLVEPQPRNTAAAVAVAARHIVASDGPDTLMLVLPADHLIADMDAFAGAVREGVARAEKGALVTFGITPDHPSTEFGYIEIDGETVRFTEKPDLEVAETFVASGRHFWNAGIFLMRAGTVLDAFRAHAPEILEHAGRALADASEMNGGGVRQIGLDANAYGAVPEISFDYAIMEKAEQIAAVPCDIGWSDLGSWAAMSELVDADGDGNRIAGEAMLVDTHNSYVRSDERLVGLVGLDNVIVIDTSDALLVANSARTGAVKDLYKRLKSDGHDTHKVHRTVHRPWGTYTVLHEGPGFKIKRIVVRPGGRLSLQMHHHRSEHWVVVTGTARVTHDATERVIGVNQSAYISKGARHRLENPGTADLVLIEVQCGDYLGEDDIVRFDDIYGRVGDA